MGKAATLYRSILRAHKTHLPPAMRSLGDTYVRAEFQRHKTAKPEHVVRFFTEWDGYLHQILNQGGKIGGGFGKELPTDIELTDDQKAQLHKLRQEAIDANKPK